MDLNSDRVKAIKDHFYSTNMTRADFERENWENYGYKDVIGFHKAMTRMNISVLKRSKHSLRPHKSFSKKSKSMKTIRKAKSLSARTERNLYERHAILMVGIPGSGKSGTKTNSSPNLKLQTVNQGSHHQKTSRQNPPNPKPTC